MCLFVFRELQTVDFIINMIFQMTFITLRDSYYIKATKLLDIKLVLSMSFNQFIILTINPSVNLQKKEEQCMHHYSLQFRSCD